MTVILLAHSYFLRLDTKQWEKMRPYPPLGTLYAAEVLRNVGHDVAVFDAMLAEGEHEFADALSRHQPRHVVLFEDNFNFLSKMCLSRMRQAALTMVGMALGGWMSGVIFDLTGSYRVAFMNGIAFNLVNMAIAMVLLGRSRKQGRALAV